MYNYIAFIIEIFVIELKHIRNNLLKIYFAFVNNACHYYCFSWRSVSVVLEGVVWHLGPWDLAGQVLKYLPTIHKCS